MELSKKDKNKIILRISIAMGVITTIAIVVGYYTFKESSSIIIGVVIGMLTFISCYNALINDVIWQKLRITDKIFIQITNFLKKFTIPNENKTTEK